MKVYDKYKNRDFIEIADESLDKMIQWVLGSENNSHSFSFESLHEMKALIKKHNGFVKFLNSGVIYNIKSNDYDASVLPFEFKDDKVFVSVMLPNYVKYGELETAFKCGVSTNLQGVLAEDVYNINRILVYKFLMAELYLHFNGKPSSLTQIFKDKPELVPLWRDVQDTSKSKQITNKIAEVYIPSLIYSCVLTVLSVNAYMVLHEKDILISKIEQKREMKAGKGDRKKGGKKNPFYRYKVIVPKDYKPRKFDANYIMEEWTRIGHTASRWVRKENAEVLAARRGGKVLNDFRGDYRRIEIVIAPTKPHRRIGKPTEKKEQAIYSVLKK